MRLGRQSERETGLKGGVSLLVSEEMNVRKYYGKRVKHGHIYKKVRTG
jgi:hypothetical protein